jgi:hypothetical protein
LQLASVDFLVELSAPDPERSHRLIWRRDEWLTQIRSQSTRDWKCDVGSSNHFQHLLVFRWIDQNSSERTGATHPLFVEKIEEFHASMKIPIISMAYMDNQ